MHCFLVFDCLFKIRDLFFPLFRLKETGIYWAAARAQLDWAAVRNQMLVPTT